MGTETVVTAILASLSGVAALWSTYKASSVKQQEARLRVQSELRLSLFARMSESAEQTSRLVRRFHRLLLNVPLGIPTDEAMADAFRSLEDVGSFLPPKLDKPFQVFLDALEEFSDPRNLDYDWLCAPKVTEAAVNYLQLYGEWKRTEYATVTTSLDS